MRNAPSVASPAARGPEPVSAVADRAYRDALYGSYVQTHAGSNGTAIRRALGAYYRANILRDMPADRSVRIADLGCGAGELLDYLASEGYHDAVGIDASAPQVRLAHEHSEARVIQGDVFAFLDQHPGEIDVILAVDLLEHLDKDEVLELLRRARAALRPGGRIIVQTCNAASPMFGRVRFGDFTHELAFTDRSIRQVLLEADLAPLAVHEIAMPVHGMRSLARAAAWQCVRAVVAAYLGIETGVARGHVLTQNLIAVAERADAPVRMAR
jgi:2-polyprenyl-3-methyl-5-hydroxy-6-metoxy-1,4-benzoquinol methylase